MAQSIQHDQATLILELSAASAPNIHSPITSPGSQLRDAIVSIPPVQNIRQFIGKQIISVVFSTATSNGGITTVFFSSSAGSSSIKAPDL